MSLKTVESKRKYSLRDFTTIKIGGQARYFFVTNAIDVLRGVVRDVAGSYYLLGGGSNLLVEDSSIDKTVLKLGEGFSYIKGTADSIEVGAATPFSCLMSYALKNNLGGFENLVGIPATVGGLIVMNASSYGRDISYSLDEVEIMDSKGEIKRLKKEDISFSYRQSSLNGKVVLRAWFKLSKEDNLRIKVSQFIKDRIAKQDFDFPSCGCIFKNPGNFAAGFLIDSCGLKGARKNGAQVSMKHANFIVNIGNATYNDVDYLISHIKDKVHRKFGLVLEEEVERWV